MFFQKKAIKILFVEDDKQDSELMQMALEKFGGKFSLQICQDGDQAIVALHNLETVIPDIIVLDLHLPKVDGHKVLRDIKNSPRVKNIPVLVFSTTTNVRDIEMITPYENTTFASKPNDFSGYQPIIESIQKLATEKR